MGQLEPEIGGGDFATGRQYENDEARARGEREERVGGAWNRIVRAVNRDLPGGLLRAERARQRIARLR